MAQTLAEGAMEGGNEDHMTMTRSRRRHAEHGAVAVEFALILPILFALVFGIIDFGFALAQSASLAHGAREGARIGVVNMVTPSTCGDVIAEVQRAGRSVGMGPEDISVEVARGTEPPCSGSTLPCAGGNYETLNVTASYETEVGVLFIEKGVTLTGEGAYRCEYK